MANSFFQAPLPGSAPILPNPTSASSPVAPPVAMPGLPDAPAPSVVNTLAPHVPAKLSYGPPDIPQTTIPSVVPTPNIPAPSAPTSMQSSTRPLGVADVPQPGASVGQTTPSNLPGALDFVAIPKIPENDRAGLTSLNFDNRLVGLQPDATPGGVMPEHNNNLYFPNNLF